MFLCKLRRCRFVAYIFPFFFTLLSSLYAQSSDPAAEISQYGMKYEQVTPTRGRINLDGKWQASTDDGKSWQSVTVPSTFDHDGQVIFERRVFIPTDFIKKGVFGIVLGNGGTSTEVRINNEYVSIHNGAYSQIDVKIPDRLLQAGAENVIRIFTNDELNPVSTIPLKQLAFQPKNFNGLFRNTFLQIMPPIYFDQSSVRVMSNSNFNSSNVKSDVVVYASDYSRFGINSTATSILLTARAEIIDKTSGKVVAKSYDNKFSLAQNHNTTVHFSMQVQNPGLWSPANPNLYELDFYLYSGTSLIDQYSETIGFRAFGLSGGKFYLNGDQIFVNSVNYVLDYPKIGAAVNELLIEKDIAVIKTLGANAIRVVNYPPPRNCSIFAIDSD